MFRHRIVVALAALAWLPACERQPPAAAESQVALQPGPAADGVVRVTDSGLVVERSAVRPERAAGDGLRPAPAPTGLRP